MTKLTSLICCSDLFSWASGVMGFYSFTVRPASGVYFCKIKLMTFDQIWQSLCRKKPNLTDSTATVEMSTGNLRALLRQVYKQGHKAGVDSVPKPSPGSPNADQCANVFGSRPWENHVFDSVFKGKK